MTCRQCGHPAETGPDGQPVPQGHNVGCKASLRAAPSEEDSLRHRSRESECIKDGCTSPRAVSKGPRPAKYCEDHKTKRSK